MSARLTVLIVDDELALLGELARALRTAGHTVTTARDGLAALELATTGEPPDVILADVAMPGLNGYQLARRVRAHPATARTALVLMSEKVSAADHHWAGEVGARELIAKPVITDEALRAVAAAGVVAR